MQIEPIERAPVAIDRGSISVARVGLVSGAATAGVLIGFGLRHGTALQPFTGAGRILLTTGTGRVPEAMLAFLGAASHFAMAAAIGWVAVAVSRRMPHRAPIIALLVAAAVWIAAEWILPTALRALTADLSRLQQLIYFSVLAVTLWGGIRLAPVADQAVVTSPN
jgi:hypothetical protein